MQLLQSLSTKGKVVLAGCALAFVVVAAMLVRMASAPAYTEVMAGMDPANAGEVTAALDEKGIAYELRGNGSTLAVEKSVVPQARIALAEAGVSGTDEQPGFELLDKQKLGASNFQQQVAYQRALEGQIANTVAQIDGVSSAKVSLTLPKDELFADEKEAATAAVLLGGSTATLEPNAVRGIANLVASSVQGLKPDHVTITDGQGTMLWPQGDGAGGGAGTMSKPAAEARYDAQLEASLDALLVSTLGEGKAHVQVKSDLNVDDATKEQLTYAKRGVPLESKEETETLESEGGGGAGAAGVAGNIPSYAQGGAGGGNSNYERESTTTNFGVDKTVTRTKVAPGAVNRLDVALVVDRSVPAATVQQLQAAISSAAGVQAARGDTLAVSQVAFAKAPEAPVEEAGPIPAGIAGYAKGAGAGLAALLFLFFVSRHLKKRERDAYADEPSWLTALKEPHAMPALPAGDPAERVELNDAQAAAAAMLANDPRAMALDELVVREPEKVAQQLRAWITEEGS